MPAALDVTVILTLQKLTLDSAATTKGYSLSIEKERKLDAHAEACYSIGVTLVPMVVESLGCWSKNSAKTIKEIVHLH